MKRLPFLILLLTFPLVGMVLAQTPPDITFTKIQDIGRQRPQGIQYDANFDRFVWTDTDSRLLLVDAASLQTQHTLYERGFYNAYKFSHNGRYLALAIERRIELWDTQSGTLAAAFEPDGALSVAGPLRFGDDDTLLLFDSIVPAPAATRRSENDTSIIPWLWDLPSARGETNSRLPRGAEAYAFFNFRTGLALAPNDALIAAIPARLQVLNGRSPELAVLSELPMNRIEVDPMFIWRSMRDDHLYIQPNNANNLLQVDTASGSAFDVPVGRDLNYANLSQMEGLKFGKMATLIGEGNSTGENALLRLLFGGGYRQYRNYAPTSIMLIDMLQPLTVSPDQMGFLIYSFDESAGRGVLEFVRPQDTLQMVLHPDNTRLMVRRASGAQPIEVYNLKTGVLERSFYPAEPDFDGSHTLAYNADGSAIITDFQRFDAATGETLLLEQDYTTGFDQYFFTEDSRKIITFNGSDWRLWDIETGNIIRRETLNLRGFVLDYTPDPLRYLTQFNDGRGEVIEIVEAGMDERRQTLIPARADRSIENIIPSPDWQNYIVVYSGGSEVAIHNFDRGQTLFLAGDDLPSLDGRSYRWRDNQTVIISGSSLSGGGQPRIYGLDYHPSGLPQCLVTAYPDAWPDFLDLWEQLAYRLDNAALNQLTIRLCGGLPADAEAVVPLLTPTPRFTYYSDSTPVPYSISGVPECLTARFPRQALDYAAAWRQMSAGLDETALAELETQLCEGLIGSLSQTQPTPTVDPNQINLPTATPVEAAPETIDSGTSNIGVMLIDITTNERTTGRYFPDVPPTPERPLNRIYAAYEKAFAFAPSGNLQLSPDGTLVAITDQFNFISVYRLSVPYEMLMADATATIEAEKAAQPRSIGLPATATQPFDYAGQPRPTLTATVSLTPPPRAEATADLPQNGQVQDICPARELYDLAAPAPGYAAAGRLILPPLDFRNDTMWVMDAASADLYPDDAIPPCGYAVNCDYSPDRDWILQQGSEIIVSRVDGTDATRLYSAEERPIWPSVFRWIGLNTLEFEYQGYVPEKFANPVTLTRRFDPTTGVLTEPFIPPDPIAINDLPTYVVSEQPVAERFLLLSVSTAAGEKYMIYDRETGAADYFARSDGSVAIYHQWHPLGTALYYYYSDDPRWYLFDLATGEHRVFGSIADGEWSRDLRYRVRWTSLDSEARLHFQQERRLQPKIAIWDSQTGITRRYCIPESGDGFGNSLTWSPDNRYLTFRLQLPPEGDTFPVFYTATPEPQEAPPTATPLPLETVYQYQNPRTLVLDTETGYVTVLTDQLPQDVIAWMEASR